MSGGLKRTGDRVMNDRDVAADPDIRGTMKGRLGVHDDARSENKNTPRKVERDMARERRTR